ncbi:MAG TPA: NUDIX hydrolase [Steroidobacteraceae bacterium]|jgi:8-oxo-dGTP pyrophosphatase MutT (NUDIX family)|nr:NUDIX hydrolase [Steroidobacteraceae bacterium]
MGRKPDVTVAAISERDGRFLMVEERINRRLLFNQPAGHVERGETLLAAVVREAREETAWRFDPQALLGIYLWRNPNSRREILRFAFTGPVADHAAAQRLDRGIIGTHWLTREQLAARHERLRSPLVLRCVHDYLAGQRRPLDGIAQLDLECAAALGQQAAVVGDGAVTARTDDRFR